MILRTVLICASLILLPEALLACEGRLSGMSGPSGNGGNTSPGGSTDGDQPGPPAGGSADGGSPPTIGDGGPSATASKTGEEVFAAVCAVCHGVEGQGTLLGPELQHPVPDYATWVARNGRLSETYPGDMAAYGESLVTDQQLEEIWTWLGSFPQPTTGEGLYEDYCAGCHGSDALGGRVDKRIDDKGANDLGEKVHQGAGGTNYASAILYMPGWTASEISEGEIALIAEYIATL